MEVHWRMNNKSIFRQSLKYANKHRGSICLIVLASLVVSILMSAQLPKKYKATTLLYLPKHLIELSLLDPNNLDATFVEGVTDEQAAEFCYNILKDKNITERIAEKVPERSFKWIFENTKIEWTPKSFNLRISVIDKDPAIAAQIANAYPEAGNDYIYESFLKPLQSKKKTIKNEIRKNETSLKKVEGKIQQLKTKFGIRSILEHHKSHLFNKRDQVINELGESKIYYKEIATKIALLEKELANETQMRVSSEAVIANPIIKDLKTSLSSIQIRLEGASSIYAKEHPKVIKLKREYLLAKKQLEKEVDRVLESQTRTINPLYEKLREMLVTNLVSHKSIKIRIKELEANLGDIKQKLSTLPKIEQEIGVLKKQAYDSEEALKLANFQLDELQHRLLPGQEIFKVIKKASIPNRYFSPNIYHIVIISGLLSLSAGLCYIFVVTIHYKKRGRQVSDIRLLEWQIPTAQLLAKELQSRGLLSTAQIYEILSFQLKESGRQFVEIAIKMGFLSGLKVGEAMKLLQTYDVIMGKPKLVNHAIKL
jgi:uncharacterized protein involved in exopolysaccharide biosynthesis